MFNVQKQVLKYALLALGVFAIPMTGFAVTDTECSQEVLLSFFPEAFVKEALTNHQIPQDKWDAILKGLAAKDKVLIKTVETKAAQMNPNPLKDTMDATQRSAAIKLFRETMQESFTSVFTDNGITDEETVLTMLDEVQEQRSKRFEACMKEGKLPTPPKIAPASPKPTQP